MRNQSEVFKELTADIRNSRVKELILSHKNIGKLVEHPRELARQHLEEVQDHEHYLKQYEERKWLIKKGKKYLIDFDNQERREMKQYFNSLDEKKTGSIGIDELEELLFSVGLFETRDEIKALIDSVDEDKSGKIEFSEFLSMIQNDEGQNEEIVSFFKTLIGGKNRRQEKPYLKRYQSRQLLKENRKGNQYPQKTTEVQESLMNYEKSMNQTNAFLMQSKYNQTQRSKSQIPEILEKYPYPKGLPFEMVVSHIRRKHMMTALNIGRAHRRTENTDTPPETSAFNSVENTVEQVAKGQRVMHALQKMYERKLIRQIKENKRANEPLPQSIAKTVEEKFRISLINHNSRRLA